MSNENEPRDDHGRWTAGSAGSGQHAAGPQMSVSDAGNAAKAGMVARRAAAVAKKLGFDPGRINVSDKAPMFELNGKTWNKAGVAYIPTLPPDNPEANTHVFDEERNQLVPGDQAPITLYTPHVSEASVDSVAAHEIEHQKFQAFINDYRREKAVMQRDPDYGREYKWATFDPTNPAHIAIKESGGPVTTPQEDGTIKVREPGFMRADGTLNEPYASRYPAYQAFTKAHMPGADTFAKSDGVTDYSAEYWKGHLEDAPVRLTSGETATTAKIPLETAMHETLAEIASLKMDKKPAEHRKLGEVEGKKVYFRTVGNGKVKPEWAALYKATDDNWKRRNKK